MVKEQSNRCPVCKGTSPIVGVDGKAEPCSRACRRNLKRTIVAKGKADKAKDDKKNAPKK